MEKEFIINSPQEIIFLGEKIGRLLKPNMIITFEGDLGAGKTTMTKGIALGLDIKSIINSPTFTIMKIHEGRLTLYHMDVYRLDASSGDDYLEEYFEAGGVCVIEWADNIDYLLPKKALNISIKNIGENSRLVKISANNSEYIDLLKEVEK